MIFFINATMQKQKSGIEHAELKRFELFNAHHVDSRFLIRDWDPALHDNTKLAGIPDENLIGMFDYFQQATHVKPKRITIDDLDFGVLNIHADPDLPNNRSLVKTAQGQLVARVNYREDHETVRSVELFDGFNNLYRVDNYDTRGFISLSQMYTPDNKVGTEVWQTPTGHVVLETFNRADAQGKVQKSGWRLTDADGTIRVFDTIEELTAHFFNLMNEKFWSVKQPNIFILDRSHLGDWGLLQLKKPAYTVMHLHNSHAGDAQEPMHSILNNNYEFAMNALDSYDAVVSATHKQTHDVEARFHPIAKLFTIPVGVVSQELLDGPRVPVKDRQYGKVVAFARIAWEKHLDDLVRAVGIVHKEVPEVSLDLYGYADASDNYRARRAVEKAIKEYDLDGVVTMKGYTTEIDKVENQAMMFGLTSRMEGFNLAVLEAISHGLISFSYDVNYGPNEIVEDGVNGNVVPFNDYKAMAAAMLKVLKDPKLAQKYSTGAYDSSERYSPANVWNAWQSLIDDANQIWPTKLAAAHMSAQEGVKQ
ncbi:glycosyltransferase family 4 protein [Secundilactobacillus folii]|uniref:Glycosyltransferase n=1 Tax=Secundilactobacillus folii TaxID=2678357 RepID=A0A7X2XVF3_9LACO|nr:glycosyltransferase [Secundilactobacillus folii]MTV82346.1 glycosyltransferase [Secundilactobacillus folii]